MTEWIFVILLISFGLILLIIEVIFIPGSTIVGIIGGISICYGIYAGYKYFEGLIGTYILIATLISVLVSFYYSFRSRVWEGFTLQKTIENKVNEDEKSLLIGSIGIAVSAIRPVGEVDFEDELREVYSWDGKWINAGKKVVILRIEGKKIFVKTFKENKK